MKLSTKGRYGLRVLLDLALHAVDSHVTLHSISERQETSARYLEQVAMALKKAGYIRSIKGAQGGYVLTKKPNEVVIGDILRIMEGDVLVVDDITSNADETMISRCLRDMVYDKINADLADLVDNMTLQTLVDRYKHMQEEKAQMYYI